jgi:hypothetical protein
MPLPLLEWLERTGRVGSVDVLRANNIAVLAGVRVDGPSTSGAQFDNIDTGEAIFVYSPQHPARSTSSVQRTRGLMAADGTSSNCVQRPDIGASCPSRSWG